MSSLCRLCVLLLAAGFLFTGCTTNPVRHLASDASLIKVGKSTRDDVLTFLGEPDSQRMVAADTEQWVYFEEKKSLMQKTPLVGKAFNPDGYGLISITFKQDLVIGCRYTSYDKDEFGWAGDFSWQDKKE
jgi:hypothetical protein